MSEARERRDYTDGPLCLSGSNVTKVFGLGEKKTVAVDHVDFDFHADHFTILAPEGYSRTVKFDEITQIDLWEAGTLDPGAPISGRGADGNSYTGGFWENRQFGEYELYIWHAVDKYIVIYQTEDRVIVTNYQSGAVTADLYASLLEKWDSAAK